MLGVFRQKELPQPIIIDISENKIIATRYSIDYKTDNIIIQDIQQCLLPFGVIRPDKVADQPAFLSALQNTYNLIKGPQAASGVVFGISGVLVETGSRISKIAREKTNKALNQNEWISLVDRVYSKLDQETYASAFGHNLPLRLAQIALQSVSLDSVLVAEPWGLKGELLSYNLHTSYIPQSYVNSLLDSARSLNLEIEGVYQHGYAVAKLLADYHSSQNISVILVDIRFEHTIVTVLSNGELDYSQSFGIGSYSFTQSIANAFQVTIDEAEGIRREYSCLQLPRDMTRRITDALEDEISLWIQALILALKDYTQSKSIPTGLFLYGEGAQLLGIKEALEYGPWHLSLNQQIKPQIMLLYPKHIPQISDLSNLASTPAYMDILGLIHVASLAGDLYIPYRVND